MQRLSIPSPLLFNQSVHLNCCSTPPPPPPPTPTPTPTHTHIQHESIVQEIEEVLRKEIIAASTLPERPRCVCVIVRCLCGQASAINTVLGFNLPVVY